MYFHTVFFEFLESPVTLTGSTLMARRGSTCASPGLFQEGFFFWRHYNNMENAGQIISIVFIIFLERNSLY